MTPPQTRFLILLTSLYLCFELAFNARLLDVVGGAASADEVHHIEIYGRSLSGIAVALVLLQLRLSSRAASPTGEPNAASIAFSCAVTALCVYAALQVFVDNLTDHSSAAFRRASLNILLVQTALVGGGAELAGLGDDPRIFAKPEGKAFLALFPVMAVSIKQLDDKLRHAKLELISLQVGRALGGEPAYYESYRKAVIETQSQWQRYSKAPTPASIDAEVAYQQQLAWAQYGNDLIGHGLRPWNVPRSVRARVVKKVQAKLPVADDWDPADELTFKALVAKQLRAKMGDVPKDGMIDFKGLRIPVGLPYERFFALPVVQAELKKSLQLPANAPAIQPRYTDADAFRAQLYKPFLMEVSRKELRRYEASTSSFGDDGVNAAKGQEAARAVIVPPVALFFSLCGAIGHFAKLSYLIAKLWASGQRRYRLVKPLLPLVPVTVLVLVWATLSSADNAVTHSSLFGYLRGQILSSATEDTQIKTKVLLNVLHVVAVGQGYSYPVNEYIRTRVLRGVTFGYHVSAADGRALRTDGGQMNVTLPTVSAPKLRNVEASKVASAPPSEAACVPRYRACSWPGVWATCWRRPCERPAR